MAVRGRRSVCAVAMCLGFLTASVEGKLSAEEPLRWLPREIDAIEEECSGEEQVSLSLSARVWIPPGTETWNVGRALHFKVPAGYVVWNRTKDGLFLPLEEGTVECACAGGGCDPVVAGSDIVCAIRPACKSGCCQRTVKSLMAAVVVTEAEGGIRRVHNRELKTLPNATAELLQVPEIAAAFEEFVAQAHQGRVIPGVDFKGNRIEAPAGYKFLPVNIYGYLASVLVPKDSAKCAVEAFAESEDEYVDDCGEGEAKVTCKCNEGTGCTYKSEKFGQLVYCESGTCSRCQMSVQ